MCFGKGKKQVNHSFGTCQGKRIFPLYHPLTLMGHTFLPIRGAPHRGPGYNIMEDTCGLAYNLTKIPTSKKGYSCGARTTMRFKPLNKDVTPDPGKYQSIQDLKYKQNFAPFNVLVPRFRTFAKKNTYPGPGTYNPEIKSPSKITWPMKFGSPDWTQVPQLQRRTLKTEDGELDWDTLGRRQTLFLALCSEVSPGRAGEQYVNPGQECIRQVYSLYYLPGPKYNSKVPVLCILSWE